MIPFLVADRPASLRIISGSNIQIFNMKIGLMSHANTSENFQNLFRIFPCSNDGFCEFIKKKCTHEKRVELCHLRQGIAKKIVKMCDSGVFTKEGCIIGDYQTLFKIYENMDVDYGIIIDYMKDSSRTLKSAKKAIEIYDEINPNFKLVGVAQGKSLNDYIYCYDALKEIGYEHIAIGGLLKKQKNCVRFARVRDEAFLFEVLTQIRKRYPNDWLFALGCYHPKRHDKFEELKLFGGDYKGWIFNYEQQNKVNRLVAQINRFKEVRNFLQEKIYKKLETTKPRFLLILPCSKTKDKNRNLIPAILRYKGPFFNVISKSSFNNDGLDVLILSAKYGLIDSSTKIDYYEQKINHQRANELKSEVLSKFKDHILTNNYAEIFVNLGNSYLKAFEECLNNVPKDTRIIIATGRIGERLHQLKAWCNAIQENEPASSLKNY